MKNDLKNKGIIGVYKITNPKGRVYIGQTKNYYGRIKSYNTLNCKRQPRLLSSFKKYSVDEHVFEIIEECEFEMLNIRERYWQDFYDVLGEKGLNCVLTKTDELPSVMSEETKRKIGDGNRGKIVLKGKDHPMFGRVVSEEEKQRVRDGLKGKHPMVGKHHSEETKQKMSETKKAKNLKGENNPNFGKKYTEERCKNISEGQKGKKLTKEHVLKLTKYVFIDIITKQIYNGCVEAVKGLNIKSSTMYSIARGERENTTNLVLLKEYDENKTYKIQDEKAIRFRE